MKLNPLFLMRREVDGTGLVFDPEHNKAMMLNHVGVTVWEAIEEGLSEDEIADKITEKFAVGKAVAAKDLEDFLETLTNHGILAAE